MRICSSTANIHVTGHIDSETTSQALFGEQVIVLASTTQWAQVELQTDGYRGFMQTRHFVEDTSPGTHLVINKTTPLFDRPDIKSAVQQLIPLASELSLKECEHQQFWQTQQQKYVWKQHTRLLGTHETGRLVDTAQRLFLGAPYLWGGRSPLGLDCSAVVQLSARLHGWQLPRDTHEQVDFFSKQGGTVVETIDYSQRQANDLVYWPGHVAIVIDPNSVVHATAHTLQCCREPIRSVEDRAGSPTSIWRLL